VLVQGKCGVVPLSARSLSTGHVMTGNEKLEQLSGSLAFKPSF
jgi:hypothetical protein